MELGTGLALLPDELTTSAVRVGVEKLLGEPAYRAAARRLADEISELPPPEDVARSLAASYSAQSATVAADEARSSTSA